MIKVLLVVLAVVVAVLNAMYLESMWVDVISKAIAGYFFFYFYWSYRRGTERMPRSPGLFSRSKEPPPANSADDGWEEVDRGSETEEGPPSTEGSGFLSGDPRDE